MTGIIIPSRRVWTRQPQRLAVIDWSNPLALGIIAMQDARTGRDVIRGGGTLYNTASITSSVSEKGVGTNYNQNQIDFPVGPDLSSNTEGTILFLGALKSGTWNVATINHGMSVRRYNSQLCFGHGSNVAGYGVTAWTGISAFCGAWRGSTAASSAFLDGKKLTNSYSSSGDTAVFATSTLGGARVGDRSSSTYWASACLLSIRWSRALTDSELALVSANPWQIFKPRTRRTIIDLGASGGLSLTATVGVADASAFSANVDLQRIFPASLASAAAAGFSANIDLRRNVLATRGDASAFGYLAGVDLRRSIIAALGAAVASGYDATVELAGALNIPASLGVAQASGRQANVNLSFDLSATPGSAAAIGLSASISNEEAPFTQAQLDYLLAYMQEHLMIPTAEEIATAVLAAMQASPPPVDVHKTLGYPLVGDGTEADPWRREGVEP